MSALLVNRGRSSSRRSNKGAPAKVVPLRDLFAAVGGLKKNPLVANRGKSRGRRRNPLVANRGKSRRRNAGSMSSGARRKMSLLAQIRPRNSRGHFLPLRANRGKGKGRRHNRRHNPLVANRGRGRRRHNPLVANRGRGRRHNPLVANRGRRGRRRNPAYGMTHRSNPFGGILGPIANALGGIPVIGPMLGAGVLALGGAFTGAISIVPVHYALKYGGKYIPEKVKPFAFTIAGALLSGIVRVAFGRMPYASELSVAMAAVGGGVDAYRKLTGTSNTLAGDYGDGWGDEGGYGADGYGEGDYGEGDLGDDGFGDDPNVRPAEWGDSSLMDAQYSGEDLSAEEMHFAELGRRAYRKRFLKRRRAGGGGGRMSEDDMLDLESDDGEGMEYGGEGGYGAPPKASKHAGRPGRRWAWLIYWIGPASFARLSKLDPAKRRQVIHAARHAAMKTAQKALTTGVTDGNTSMESMEAAGLLAAA